MNVPANSTAQPCILACHVCSLFARVWWFCAVLFDFKTSILYISWVFLPVWNAVHSMQMKRNNSARQSDEATRAVRRKNRQQQQQRKTREESEWIKKIQRKQSKWQPFIKYMCCRNWRFDARCFCAYVKTITSFSIGANETKLTLTIQHGKNNLSWNWLRHEINLCDDAEEFNAYANFPIDSVRNEFLLTVYKRALNKRLTKFMIRILLAHFFLSRPELLCLLDAHRKRRSLHFIRLRTVVAVLSSFSAWTVIGADTQSHVSCSILTCSRNTLPFARLYQLPVLSLKNAIPSDPSVRVCVRCNGATQSPNHTI